jgi:hypothetical protein
MLAHKIARLLESYPSSVGLFTVPLSSLPSSADHLSTLKTRGRRSLENTGTYQTVLFLNSKDSSVHKI